VDGRSLVLSGRVSGPGHHGHNEDLDVQLQTLPAWTAVERAETSGAGDAVCCSPTCVTELGLSPPQAAGFQPRRRGAPGGSQKSWCPTDVVVPGWNMRV
jgi:hypothetical protein